MQQSIIKKDLYEFREKANLIQQKTDLFFSLFKNDYPSLEVKASNVHGKGVFACEDIEAWRITTVYPAHYVCAGHAGGMIFHTEYMNELHKLDKHINKYMMNFEPNDNVNINPKYRIKISADPSILNSGVGHMLNDAGMMSELSLKQYKAYLKASQNKVNCISYHIGSGIVVVASTKPIKKGEEMFLCYGIPYWFEGDTWVPFCSFYKKLSMEFAKLQLIRENVFKEKIENVLRSIKKIIKI